MAGARGAPVELLAAAVLSTVASTALFAQPATLRWGGDAEGGSPFVEADPNDPSKVRGFDVEVAETIARGLGRTSVFVQVAFQQIDASVVRGDFDIGLSGVEDTPARRSRLSVTLPYFEFREVLTVRAADRDRFRRLDDLRGRRVGTLVSTIAYETLLAARERHGTAVVSYDDDVHPYTDLLDGRLDAVLLDHIIAARSMRRLAGLFTHPGAVATGHYVGILARENTALRTRIDAILREAMRDGTLERIYRKWEIWDDEQASLFQRTLTGATGDAAVPTVAAKTPALATALAYLPALFKAALVTLVLSCFAMALAVAAGSGIATGRIYGTPPVRALLTGYVELVRGTPVLLQLFVLYYGLAALVHLPAFVAALLGLGLNYAAYESEIYRGALEAVPRVQLEAARTLGLTEAQILRLVRGPQALRLALAPMTNDFVALLKDSSLVSVITVVELTKETAIFATNIGSWVLPGALCAAIYLAMSLPLSRLARRLERRWGSPS